MPDNMCESVLALSFESLSVLLLSNFGIFPKKSYRYDNLASIFLARPCFIKSSALRLGKNPTSPPLNGP